MHSQNLSLILAMFQNLMILIFYHCLKQKTKNYQNSKLQNIYKTFIKQYLQVIPPAEAHYYKKLLTKHFRKKNN